MSKSKRWLQRGGLRIYLVSDYLANGKKQYLWQQKTKRGVLKEKKKTRTMFSNHPITSDPMTLDCE